MQHSVKASWRAWYGAKSPVFRFGLKFCAFTAFFYALSHAPFWSDPLSAYLSVNARISSAILRLVGQENTFSGATIHSGRFAITVDSACAAFEFVWFICAAVLSFPATFADRLLGIVAATGVILALNIMRIVSLFLVGTHHAGIFNTVHVAIWPSILVVATLLLMVGWIDWSRRREAA